jgi:hypothetical protein
MAEIRRTRTGALVGALAGPPAVTLVLAHLFEHHDADLARIVPGLYLFPGILAVAVGGGIGAPLLGACIASRSWLTAETRRKVTSGCAAGGLLGTVAAGILLRTAPTLGLGGRFLMVVLFMEAGLVGGVLLSFRDRGVKPPA